MEINCTLLKLPSDANCIKTLESHVKLLASKYKISQDKYPEILVSLTEAVNNAVTHGNQLDNTKSVEVCHKILGKTIVFTISDQGNGFDPHLVNDPTKKENLTCCGGRGVHIMKALANQISYQNDGRTVELHFDVQ